MMQILPTRRRTQILECLCGALVLLSGLSAIAETIPARYLLTSAQIVTAMKNRQLPTEDVQIRIPAPITASVAEASLDVQSVTLVGAHSAQLKILCRNHSECLPFYISATWPDASAPLVIPTSLQHGSHSIQLDSPAKDAAEAVIEKPASSRTTTTSSIHPGSPATLLMDHDRIHLSLHVICLESGAPGDKVRVTTPDRKQAYVAEIITPTLLKGSF